MKTVLIITFLSFHLVSFCQLSEFVDVEKTMHINYPNDWTKNEEIGKNKGLNVIVVFIEPVLKANFTITKSKIETDNFVNTYIQETEKQFENYLPNYKNIKLDFIEFKGEKAHIREYSCSDKEGKYYTYTKQVEVRKNGYSYILSFNCPLQHLETYKDLPNIIFNSFQLLKYTKEDCQKVIFGTYFYDINDPNSYIETEGEIQTEFGLKENLKIKSSKSWVSKNEYFLKVEESTFQSIPIGSLQLIKILECNEKSYSYIWEYGKNRGKNTLYKK